jgi:hypothetical protein
MPITGGCHCGKVRFEVEMKLERAISCNCSVCSKRGSLLDFVPESSFKLISGSDNLTDYQFNKKVIHHLFCRTCGILPFGKATAPDGTKMVAVNVRCLDDFDIEGIKIEKINGKDF